MYYHAPTHLPTQKWLHTLTQTYLSGALSISGNSSIEVHHLLSSKEAVVSERIRVIRECVFVVPVLVVIPPSDPSGTHAPVTGSGRHHFTCFVDGVGSTVCTFSGLTLTTGRFTSSSRSRDVILLSEAGSELFSCSLVLPHMISAPVAIPLTPQSLKATTILLSVTVAEDSSRCTNPGDVTAVACNCLNSAPFIFNRVDLS